MYTGSSTQPQTLGTQAVATVRAPGIHPKSKRSEPSGDAELLRRVCWVQGMCLGEKEKCLSTGDRHEVCVKTQPRPFWKERAAGSGPEAGGRDRASGKERHEAQDGAGDS